MEVIIKWALAITAAILLLTLAVRLLVFFFANIGLVAAVGVIAAAFWFWEDICNWIDKMKEEV